MADPRDASPVREVVRRDGVRERFDPARLSASIHRAAVAVGQGELLLAEELAALIALVLQEEFGASAPATRAVRETAERVLMETGHHDVARSYILLHAPSGASTAPVGERSARDGASHSGVRVASLGRECLENFDVAKVATCLMVDCGLMSGEASTIASAVERKVHALGEPIVNSATVRQLVACELIDRDRGELLARVQGLGIPSQEVEAVAFARAGAERCELLLGGELMRRYSLARLLDPAVAQAHLGGDLHLDGLHAPGQALAAVLDFAEVRRVALPGALAALLHLVHGLESTLHGTLALHHVERALAPAFDDDDHAREVARSLLLALADGPAGRQRSSSPRRVIGVGADLPSPAATALFRRGGAPEAVRSKLKSFVTELLDQSVAFATHLRLPRVRLLVDPGEEERELVELTRSLQPALALGAAEIGATARGAPTVRVVGARVGLNIARLGLVAGRRRESELLASLGELVERSLSAGANVLRHLLHRDELGVGFLRRLRDLTREIGRDLPLDLPGSHAYQLVLVPIGVDAAVRAVTERDPSESESAAQLREAVLAKLKEAVPDAALAGTRFELCEEPFPEAEARFGRLDWLSFPRGRDVLGLAHDGAAFRYSFDPAPRNMSMAVAGATAVAMAAAAAGSLSRSVRSLRPSEGDDAP